MSYWLKVAYVSLLLWPALLLAQSPVTLRPTADGTNKAWNNTSGTACTSASPNCYTLVNETSGSTCSSPVAGDGATTLNVAPATSGLIEGYALTLTSIPNGAIVDSVVVYGCIQRGATSPSARWNILLNGVRTNGAAFTPTSSYSVFNTSFTPSWTKAGTDTLQIEAENRAAKAENLSTIAAVITYHVNNASTVTGSAGAASSLVQQTGRNLAPAGSEGASGAFQLSQGKIPAASLGSSAAVAATQSSPGSNYPETVTGSEGESATTQTLYGASMGAHNLTLAASPILQLQLNRIPTGSDTLTATFAKGTGRLLGGSEGESGNFTRALGKPLAGSAGESAAFRRSFGKPLAGSEGESAALTRTVQLGRIPSATTVLSAAVISIKTSSGGNPYIPVLSGQIAVSGGKITVIIP
jgi:hypothetical protein